MPSGCGGEADNPREIGSDFFGINAQYVGLFPSQGRADLLGPHLDAIADLEVDFVRSNVAWSVTEPTQPDGDDHEYDFSAFDQLVEAMATRDLSWQPTLAPPVPPWAADKEAASQSCGSNAPPIDERGFSLFAGALASRYGKGGTFWTENPELPSLPVTNFEIWNEPNYGVAWCPDPDPARYARLYVASRDAILAVDPTATVMVGGLSIVETTPPGESPASLSAADFLSEFASGLELAEDAVDAIAVHPYGSDADRVLESFGSMRSAADDAGFQDVPLVANEVGWPTSGVGGLPPVPETVRAGYMVEVTEAAPFEGCDVIAFAPHTWTTPQRDVANPEDWYGMADPVSAQPFPTALAFGNAIESVESDDSASGEDVC